MKHVVYFGISVLVAILWTCPADARQWTDRAGRVCEAELVGFRDGFVYLEKQDGIVYKVALERLSQADQEFVLQSKGNGDDRGRDDTTGQSAPTRGLQKLIIREAAERFDRGSKWAVVVGINQYLDPKIADLQFCVADARLVANTLTEKSGYEPQRILLITDDQQALNQRPSKRVLEDQVPRWLSRVKKGDTVFVYFSGHGYEVGGKGYLIPNDCFAKDIEGGGFEVRKLLESLNNCQATQKLLVLDCCHAGAAKDGTTMGPSSEKLSRVFRDAKGLITLAGCAIEERSYEWPAKGHGLFTYFLSEGLQGAADADHNGIVDSDELYKYLDLHVPLVAQKELNGQQTPRRNIPPTVKGVFALARVTLVPPPQEQAHSQPPQEEVPVQPQEEETFQRTARLREHLRFTYGSQTPSGWEVSQLDNQVHRIRRGDLQVAGDFYLEVQLQIQKQRGTCEVVLLGSQDGSDLRLGFCQESPFSNGANWLITSPKEQVRKPFPWGSRTFRLERRGEMFRLACDRTLENRGRAAGVVMSQFVADNAKRFEGIDIGASDGGVIVEEIRVGPLAPVEP